MNLYYPDIKFYCLGIILHYLDTRLNCLDISLNCLDIHCLEIGNSNPESQPVLSEYHPLLPWCINLCLFYTSPYRLDINNLLPENQHLLPE